METLISTQSIISATSVIIGIPCQSIIQSKEIVTTLAASDANYVLDSTITAVTSSSLNDSSSTEIPIPITTNSTLRLSNGMEILEIEKYRRAQVKLTRCNDVEITETSSMSRTIYDKSALTLAKESLISSKKRLVPGRKGNGVRAQHTSEPPSSDEKRFICRICSKRFGVKWKLTRHIRVHTGDKPLKCILCCKKFNDAMTLKHHLLSHDVGRCYKCLTCTEIFERKRAFVLHCIRLDHVSGLE